MMKKYIKVNRVDLPWSPIIENDRKNFTFYCVFFDQQFFFQASKMKRFVEIINDFQSLTIFSKRSILAVLRGLRMSLCIFPMKL